jgi:hypothetical protein
MAARLPGRRGAAAMVHKAPLKIITREGSYHIFIFPARRKRAEN